MTFAIYANNYAGTIQPVTRYAFTLLMVYLILATAIYEVQAGLVGGLGFGCVENRKMSWFTHSLRSTHTLWSGTSDLQNLITIKDGRRGTQTCVFGGRD